MIAGRAVPTGFGLTVYSTPAVRIRIDYTNGKGTVSVYERVTVRASWRTGMRTGRAVVARSRGAGVECRITSGRRRVLSCLRSRVDIGHGGSITKLRICFVLTVSRCLALTLFRLVFPPDGYTREIPTGIRSCPRYLGAAVSLGGSWRRRASGTDDRHHH